jgi:hypothetical protein
MSSRHKGKVNKRDAEADAEAAAYAAAVPVLLGLPGDWCDDVGGERRASYRHSRAGGVPAWPPHGAPPSALLACGECSAPRQLVLQSYAPLPAYGGERVLYVMACLNTACTRTAATCDPNPSSNPKPACFLHTTPPTHHTTNETRAFVHTSLKMRAAAAKRS